MSVHTQAKLGSKNEVFRVVPLLCSSGGDDVVSASLVLYGEDAIITSVCLASD
jgi:hypothetical protein